MVCAIAGLAAKRLALKGLAQINLGLDIESFLQAHIYTLKYPGLRGPPHCLFLCTIAFLTIAKLFTRYQ